VGSIPNEVTAFFNLPNPWGHTLALGSTQLQTEMKTRNLPGGGGSQCIRLTTSLCHFVFAVVMGLCNTAIQYNKICKSTYVLGDDRARERERERVCVRARACVCVTCC
jgi:hypothetical protein